MGAEVDATGKTVAPLLQQPLWGLLHATKVLQPH